MMRIVLAGALALAVVPAMAQTIETIPLFDDNADVIEPTVSRQHVTVSPDGVLLRALDKISGEIVDFELSPGQTKQLGYIQVTLGECRYPTTNPSGDAFAHLQVRVVGNTAPVFSGWMVASSPSLNALDHARYDVWPLRCKIPSGD